MGRVVGVKVAEHTLSSLEGIHHRVHNKDSNNQKGKDLISESGSKLDIAGQVKESSQEAVSKKPDGNPSIPVQVVNTSRFSHVLDGSGDGQGRSSGSNDTHGHTSNQTVGNSNPRGSKDSFNGTNLVVGHLSIGSTKGKGGRDDGNEHQKGHSNSLLVEVGHLLEPPSSNSPLDITNDSFSPWLSRGKFDLTVFEIRRRGEGELMNRMWHLPANVEPGSKSPARQDDKTTYLSSERVKVFVGNQFRFGGRGAVFDERHGVCLRSYF